MKVLKQTSTQLIIRHQQSDNLLIAISCLLICVMLIMTMSITPEIICQRTGSTRQCKLISHMLGGLKFEQVIHLKSAKNQPICSSSRHQTLRCSLTESLVLIQTQTHEITFIVDLSSGYNITLNKVQDFIKNSNRDSLQIRSAYVSLYYPSHNIWLFILCIILFSRTSDLLSDKLNHTCKFDKVCDRVIVKSQKPFFNASVIEFPLSMIQSIGVYRNSSTEYIVLYLKSQQEVRIAEASCLKNSSIEVRIYGKASCINQDIEKYMQVIASFLELDLKSI